MKLSLPKIKKGYIPSEKEEYMNPLQLHYFKKILFDRKQQLLEEVEDFK